MSLKDLKKRSKDSLSKFKSEMDVQTSGNSYTDDRLWTCPFDTVKGTGEATIRFLPAMDGEDLPWIKLYSHGFKGPSGRWYIENSLTTIGKDDPLGNLNSRLWNSGVESDKEVARKQKRRLNYYSNVLIINDPEHPENNGTVRLFRYGAKLFEKIQEAMNPEFEGEEAINPFDLWEGADFVIRIKTVENYRNYDKSSFKSPSEVGTDSEMDEIWGKCHSLMGFLDESNFKTYGELATQLKLVLGEDVGSGVEVIEGTKSVPRETVSSTTDESSAGENSSEEMSDLEYFESLSSDS